MAIKDTKVDIKPGHLTTEGVLEAFKKFHVGEKVIRYLNGERVEDAPGGGRPDMLEVTQAMVTMRLEFAVVKMEWVGSARDGEWHLSYSSRHGGSGENLKSTSEALWKLLCTSWHVGIRGVIV